MSHVGVSNLVQAAEAVDSGEQDTGLNSSNTRLGGLKLPEPSCFGDEAILQRMGIPVLSTVRKSGVACLETGQTDRFVNNSRDPYASISKNNIDKKG